MAFDSTNLENDQFGYSCYVVVVPAPPELKQQLLTIESAAGQERAKIPAHITVKGTMYGIVSLDQVIEQVKAVASRHEPFSVNTEGMGLVGPDHSVIVGFPVNPEIQALHDDLMEHIAPLGKPAYPDDPYLVHMSIVNHVGEADQEIARNLLSGVDFGDVIPVHSIELLARDGVAWGGTWKRLESFELGG